MSEPDGILVHHHSEVHQNKQAVYVETYLVDEAGMLWHYHSSSFKFALEPAQQEEGGE